MKKSSQNTKLAFICGFYNYAGTEVSAFNWLNMLVKEYDVDLYVVKDNVGVEKYLDHKVKVIRLKQLSNVLLKRVFYFDTLASKAMKKQKLNFWQKIIENNNYAAIINFMDLRAAYFEDLRKIPNCPKLIGWNHFNYQDYKVKQDKIPIQRIINEYRFCDEIISVSKQSAQALKNVLQEDFLVKNIKTIYTPVDVDKIIEKSNDPIAFKFDKSKLNVIQVGRIDMFEKNQSAMLLVHKKLLEEQVDHNMIFIGSFQSKQDKVLFNKYIKNLEIAKSVFHFEGVTNPFPYMKQSDIVVLPSISEGYGLVVLEALVLNKLVLTTDTSAAEIVDYGKYGKVVSTDTEEIYLGLKELIEDKELQTQYYEAIKHYHAPSEEDAIKMFEQILTS